MTKGFAFILGALLLVGTIQSSLGGTITSLNLQVGQTVHVTVVDQGGTPIDPSTTSPPMLVWSPTGTPSIVAGTPDPTPHCVPGSTTCGFTFNGTAAGSVNATVTYTAPSGVVPSTVTATLPMTVVSAPVTSMTFTSP